MVQCALYFIEIVLRSINLGHDEILLLRSKRKKGKYIVNVVIIVKV